MLQYLHIENIAVIEEANIEFTDGFNVLTGETGAGKSIIIDSLFAVLGERTSRELIRHGCEKALVSASFTDIGNEAVKALEELGYTVNPAEELIIQRVLFADGRGQVKINMQPANVTALKTVGKYLVNIHGQHDNQILLNPEKHISFVDAFAENQRQKENYILAFNKFKNVTKELNAISENELEKLRKIDLLKFQTEEIEAAEISPGEVESLKKQIALQQKAEAIVAGLKAAETAVLGNDSDDNNSVLDLLRFSLKNIEAVVPMFGEAEKVSETLSELVLNTEAVVSDIQLLLEKIDIDPKEIQKSVSRLDLIERLMLKYGNTEENILEYFEKAKSELETFEFENSRKAELEELIVPLQQSLIDAGDALTLSRTSAAKEICKKVSNELEFLDFTGAVFKADITKGKYTKNGCDNTEFLISANIGEVPKALVKIASGGELSRIMLAIRSVLSLKDDVGTLVFDEIDTGISGHAAQKVAVKLYDVSKKRQVICVTHLAQIAAAADNHLYISKSVSNGKTYTRVGRLDYNGRVKEIARIMSGGEYTENLLKTAEEMLNFHS